MCRAVAGNVFVSDPNGQSVVADPTAEPLERILEAAADCPVGAIIVEDAETREQLQVLMVNGQLHPPDRDR
jgi:hypothetical protein